jgi:hypothetical protein
MFNVGDRVMVITDKGVAYDATILARAKGDHGTGAYKVAQHGLGPEQLGQWHRACEIFLPEKNEEKPDDSESFMKD